MKKLKVYMASPYTKGDVAINVKVQMDVANILINMGCAPFVPLLTHFLHMAHPRPYEQWFEYDTQWLLSCDCVLRLHGESVGADKEVEIATEHGIRVFHTISGLHKYINSHNMPITTAKEFLEDRGIVVDLEDTKTVEMLNLMDQYAHFVNHE